MIIRERESWPKNRVCENQKEVNYWKLKNMLFNLVKFTTTIT